MCDPKTGFSLVELSIVLVILGLLVGGILGGQSLIRAAELRSVSNEYEQWQTAINSFRMKYQHLPGDMPIATRFWGKKSTCPPPAVAAGAAHPAPVRQTCDGDGNGLWGDVDGTTASQNYEQLLLWQHLANAGLISGQYSAHSLAGSTSRRSHYIGVNCPRSRYNSSTCWGMMFIQASGLTDAAGHGVYFPSGGGNIAMLGTSLTGTATPHWPNGAAMTAEDMWNIDMKMDDGLPDTGKVRSSQNHSNCYVTVDGQRQYDFSRSKAECLFLVLERP